jgi:dTDP-4-amino-4,6-dideoxygalactose transaminase
MNWRLPLANVQLTEPVIEAAMEALASNWLTMGPRTQELEAAFAEQVGVPHAVAVSSGTSGLHLACLAAGVGPGDEVIVPALGFVADAHAAHWCGGTTVFADVASVDQPLLDPEGIERLITDRTKAVLAVHMYGYPLELDGIRALCESRGITLIEDCCEAVGATFSDGSSVGTAGQSGVFSFFAKTQLPVGEGGIVVTADESVAERVRLLRSHAMTSVTWDRHRGHAETYDITDLGYNFRLDEPRAAMAHAHLRELDGRLTKLRGTVAAYREHLAGVDGVTVPFEDDQAARAGDFAFPVVVADGETRDRVRAQLCDRGVQTTFYPSITTLSLYEAAGREHPCPLAEEMAARHLAMPLSTSMTPDDVELACSELAAAVAAVAVG